jgi:hypothetical protein
MDKVQNPNNPEVFCFCVSLYSLALHVYRVAIKQYLPSPVILPQYILGNLLTAILILRIIIFVLLIQFQFQFLDSLTDSKWHCSLLACNKLYQNSSRNLKV